MTPHKQTIKHDPARGLYGDCYRTAIASLLDLPPESVPHFCDGPETKGDDVTGRAREWLAGRGLSLVRLPLFCSDVGPVFELMGECNPGALYLLTGQSPRGFNHVVVCRGGKLAHDPSQEGGGLVGPCDDGAFWVEIIGRN